VLWASDWCQEINQFSKACISYLGYREHPSCGSIETVEVKFGSCHDAAFMLGKKFKMSVLYVFRKFLFECHCYAQNFCCPLVGML